MVTTMANPHRKSKKKKAKPSHQKDTAASTRTREKLARPMLGVCLALTAITVLIFIATVPAALEHYELHGHVSVPVEAIILGLVFTGTTMGAYCIWWHHHKKEQAQNKDDPPPDESK